LPNLPPAGDVVDWIDAFINNAFLDWDGYKPIPKNVIDNGALLVEFQKAVREYSEPI
jgi:hypothetical protein